MLKGKKFIPINFDENVFIILDSDKDLIKNDLLYIDKWKINIDVYSINDNHNLPLFPIIPNFCMLKIFKIWNHEFPFGIEYCFPFLKENIDVLFMINDKNLINNLQSTSKINFKKIFLKIRLLKYSTEPIFKLNKLKLLQNILNSNKFDIIEINILKLFSQNYDILLEENKYKVMNIISKFYWDKNIEISKLYCLESLKLNNNPDYNLEGWKIYAKNLLYLKRIIESKKIFQIIGYLESELK